MISAILSNTWIADIFKNLFSQLKVLVSKYWYVIVLFLLLVGFINYKIVQAKTKFIKSGLKSKNKVFKVFTIIIIVLISLYYIFKGVIK